MIDVENVLAGVRLCLEAEEDCNVKGCDVRVKV